MSPRNMLAQAGGGQFSVNGMPSQRDIDELWARSPTDGTAAYIEQLVGSSRGALTAPWDGPPIGNIGGAMMPQAPADPGGYPQQRGPMNMLAPGQGRY